MDRVSAVLLACALGLASCAEPPPPNAAFACSGTLCPAFYECREGYCFPMGGDGGCVRRTCRSDQNCGEIPDGCQGTVSCGACPVPATCAANVCTCTPETDQALCGGLKCGELKKTDRCGTARELQCGSCPMGQACRGTDAGQSSCTTSCIPESNAEFCARKLAVCGPLSGLDNCDTPRTLSCGNCQSLPDAGVGCLGWAQWCSYDWECCDGRSCFTGRCTRLDGGH